MFCYFQLKGPDICIMTRRSGVMGYQSIYTTRKDAKKGNEICTQNPELMMTMLVLLKVFVLLQMPQKFVFRARSRKADWVVDDGLLGRRCRVRCRVQASEHERMTEKEAGPYSRSRKQQEVFRSSKRRRFLA